MQECAKCFPLSADIELPPEINDSLAWLNSSDADTITIFRDTQLDRLSSLVNERRDTQEKRFNSTPEPIRGGRNPVSRLWRSANLCTIST